MISSAEALDRLRDGNRRFVSQEPGRDGNQNRAPGPWLSGGQEPFAIVLGCSDSRVPMEIVFDQGLGDLFVVRVAGNIVDGTAWVPPENRNVGRFLPHIAMLQCKKCLRDVDGDSAILAVSFINCSLAVDASDGRRLTSLIRSL